MGVFTAPFHSAVHPRSAMVATIHLLGVKRVKPIDRRGQGAELDFAERCFCAMPGADQQQPRCSSKMSAAAAASSLMTSPRRAGALPHCSHS